MFLTQDELETMFNKQFSTDRLNQVKDIFLFSRFTGLAYVDVKKLTENNIGMGVDGEKWIFINRTKTDTRSNIRLSPIPAALIEKYKNHPQSCNQGCLLPILSNQKMNSYLNQQRTNISHCPPYLCHNYNTYQWHTYRKRFKDAWT